MDKFRVEVIAKTPNPQQVIYTALHQDYSENFVVDERELWPDEAKCGEVIVKRLLAGERGHFGPLEHPQIIFNVGYFPHSVMQQVRTHRVGISFDVQCLAANTEITFVNCEGTTSKKLRKTIGELYDLWVNGEKAIRKRGIRGRKGEAPGEYRRDCQKRIRKMRLRVLNEATGYFEVGHIKEVICSGIQPIYRVHLEDGKSLDCTINHRLFTSQGWQTMGDAVGLVTGLNNEVLALTKACEVMCNGVVRPNVLYTHKAWLQEQSQLGLTAQELALICNCDVNVIRKWSKHHGISLISGYKKGKKTQVGDGKYRDKKWLEAKLSEGLFVDQIAEQADCSIESIKKWVYKHGLKLNKRPSGTTNPWNKGNGGYTLNLSEESIQIRRENAKKYTKRGENSNFWKGGTSTEREMIDAWTRQIAPQVHKKFNYICQKCGIQGRDLQAHHLIPVFADLTLAYEFENLVTLCKECHEYIHHNNQEAEFAQSYSLISEIQAWSPKPKPLGNKLSAHPVKVKSVEYLGEQMTYDLEVEDPWHNFVANGMVVHNSNRYTGTRIIAAAKGEREIEEVFYLRPVGHYFDRQGKRYDYTETMRAADLEWCKTAAKRYQELIDQGVSEEHARGIIPFDVRQHFVLSVNVRSLMHLLDMRWKKDAQLECQQLCELLIPHFKEWTPEIAQWYIETRGKKARLSP